MSGAPAYQRFFAELKRRHVFRVAAGYGAVGFAILQAADILFPRLGLPDWTVTLVAALTLLGFPVALVLAWAYDRDATGVRRTDPAATGELEAIAAEPAGKRWPVGLAALAGVVLLGIGAWWVLGPRSGDSDRAAESAGHRYDSIAVLPFENLTGDEQDQYLGDGLAEELLNALTRLEGIRVASRTSAFAFRDAAVDARTIGDSLGVATVLEGSVRRSPDRLRVTAQLIDAEDGFHLWSETYDRAPADLLDIQDDLTGRIVEALAVTLAPDAGATDATGAGTPASEPAVAVSPARRGTESAEAYDLYLQGRYFWNKRTYDDMQVAIGLFDKAIAADSGFAPAYAAIADCYVVPAGWGDDPEGALNAAERYARRALEIDPTLAQAHVSLAGALDWNLEHAAAEASIRRGIELDPKYPTAHQWYAEVLASTGRKEQGLAEARLAESLDPTMIIRFSTARVLYFAGRYEEAIEQVDRVTSDGGSYGGPLREIRFDALWMLGRYEEALRQAATDTAAFSSPAPYAAAQRLRNAAAREVLGAAEGGAPPAALARAFDRLDRERGRSGTAPVPSGNPGVLLQSASLWTVVDTDSALARLAAIVRDPDDLGARIAWADVRKRPEFEPLASDPRFQELDAAFPR